MSIFLDTVAKNYSDTFQSNQMFNLSWDAFQLPPMDILNGYLHSLYANISDDLFTSIYRSHFMKYNNYCTVYISDANEVDFAFINPAISSLNGDYVFYDIYKVTNTILHTLDYTNLIYSIDTIQRRTERRCLQYEQFMSMNLAATANWIYYQGGFLLIGSHYMPKNFILPQCLNDRRNEAAKIEKMTRLTICSAEESIPNANTDGVDNAGGDNAASNVNNQQFMDSSGNYGAVGIESVNSSVNADRYYENLYKSYSDYDFRLVRNPNMILANTRPLVPSIAELSDYNVCKFIYFMSPSKNRYRWNYESMTRFATDFNIPLSCHEPNYILTRTNVGI